MQNVYPTLRIADYDAARAFYVDMLGFQIDWEHRFEPGFPVFMHISRDRLALYLSQHRRAGPAGGLVYLYVPDVDAWYSELSAWRAFVRGIRTVGGAGEGVAMCPMETLAPVRIANVTTETS